MQHRTGLLARDQIAVVFIGAIGEYFVRQAEVGFLAGPHQFRIGEHHEDEIGVDRLDRIRDRRGGQVVLASDVGQRAMRLDMRDLVAGRGRDRLQGADLVGDEVFDFG